MKKAPILLILIAILLNTTTSLTVANTLEVNTSSSSRADPGNSDVQTTLQPSSLEKNTKASNTGSWGTALWTFDENNGVLNISSGQLGNSIQAPWNNGIDSSKIITIVISPNTQAIENSASLFSGLVNLVTIDGFQNLDTSLVTSMEHMFAKDVSLTTVDLSSINTSNVTNMSGMFESTSLTNYDLSSFNTSSVTDMSGMFTSAEAGNLDLSSLDTHNVKNMSSMFEYARLTNINLSSFNTENVSSMRAMFSGNSDLVDLNIDNFDTSNVINMGYMFEGDSNLKSLNLTNFNTNKVTEMRRMFDGCDSLQELSLGETFRFISDASLGIPVPIGGKGTGKWIKQDHTSKGYMPSDFMNFYGTNDLTSGTYIAELIGVSVNVQDSTLYVGDSWTAKDNFVNATDQYGNTVDFSQITVSGQPDLSLPGTYKVNYTYDGVTSTATIIVKENLTKVNVHDSVLYLGEDAFWTAEDNFDNAFDKEGKPLNFNNITVDDSQMIDPYLTTPGEYDIKYSYDEVTSIAHISVREIKLALNVHNSTISVGNQWKAEDNFDSAFDKDGNAANFNEVTFEGDVDTTKVGSYDVTYSYLGLKKKATVTVISPLKLTVPTSTDFGKYKLGTSTTVLYWNKASRVEVESADNMQWDLSVSEISASNIRDYLKVGDQSLSEEPIKVSTGSGSRNILDEIPSDQFIKVDYKGAKKLGKSSGVLEWTLTPSTSEVLE